VPVVAAAISSGQMYKALLIEKITLATLLWLQWDGGRRAAISTGMPKAVVALKTAKTQLQKQRGRGRKRSRG
jgi:hypothetical protein